MAAKQNDEQKTVVDNVLHAFKEGELETGSGKPVTTRRQAIAIALSEAGASDRQDGAEKRRRLGRARKKGLTDPDRSDKG